MWSAALAAAIITLVIRLMVYGNDCNLMVVGMTFIFFFAVIGGSLAIVRKIITRCRDSK